MSLMLSVCLDCDHAHTLPLKEEHTGFTAPINTSYTPAIVLRQ